MEGIITAWGKILRGYRPSLSIEITRECPLRCPGCYAYGDDHLGGDVTLRQVTDYKGQDLIDHVLAIVDEEKPLHVSIVGGEPLVRFRELNVILPKLAERGVYTQLVTSAVRPVPAAWAAIPRLQICVSIDGLQPEHDVRRAPATDDCVFAQTTTCVSADFEHRITPCQFGGNPDCSQCGCMASAGLAAVAEHRLPGGLRVGAIFEASLRVGRAVRHRREAVA